ncbi:hypothetical protein U9M48_036897 [Paspalum notatum var. saurae]|uniref:Uncharacterized protein n=1 Tax=Paspalum notatum var. saurae TaxID=547442 RepID=A0AAQ3XBS3_PASNO
MGAVHKVENGEMTFFWKDVWLDKVPWSVNYHELYGICEDKDALVCVYWDGREWNIEFRCERGGGLMVQLQEGWMDGNMDTIEWVLDKSRQFTTKSLYRFRTDGGFMNKKLGVIWKCRIPKKIKLYTENLEAVVVLKN